MNSTLLFRLNAGLLAAWLAASALAWPHLPERVPIHFDLAGNPTRWVGTSPFSWFGLTAIGALTSLFVWGMAWFGRRNPSLWNVPDRSRFVRLSPQARAPIVERMERVAGWTAVLCTVIFAAVQALVYASATGRSGLPWSLLHGVIWGAVALILWVALTSTRGMREEIRAAAEAEGIPPPRFG
jgi:uncharacterized membrane protein